MSETAVILGERDFEQFRQDVREQITKEVSSIRGLFVRGPMDCDQAAKFMSVSKKTLLKWVKMGKIRATKIGGIYLFLPDELLEDIKSKK